MITFHTDDLRPMRPILLLTLILVGCNLGVPSEVTQCGMLVLTDTLPNGQTFEQVQGLETEFLTLADQIVTPDDARFARDQACKAINGYTLKFIDTLTKVENGMTEDLAGQTSVQLGLIEVEPRESIRVGSLVHELAHVVQHGKPNCSVGYDDMHGCWDQHGITYVIDTIRAKK